MDKMLLEGDTERHEEEEFEDSENSQGVERVHVMLRKASRIPIRGRRKVRNSYSKQDFSKPTPLYKEPDVLKAMPPDMKTDIFQAPPTNLEPDIFQAPDLHQNRNPFQSSLMDTKPDVIRESSSVIKPDIFQVNPSDLKEDIFHAPPSDLKRNIFRVTPSNLKSNVFQSKPSNQHPDLFQATSADANPDIFLTSPSIPNNIQVTPLDMKGDIFQSPPSNLKPNPFQARPSTLKPDIFQITPCNQNSDSFQATCLDPEPNVFLPSPSNLKPDIFQSTPSNLKTDIFQTLSSDLNPNTFPSTPLDLKLDVSQVIDSNQNPEPFQATSLDPKTDIFWASPSNLKPDIFQVTPSNTKQNIFQPSTSNPMADLFQASLSDLKTNTTQATTLSTKLDIIQATFSNQNAVPLLAPTLDPKRDICSAKPSDLKPEIFQAISSDLKEDIFQPMPSDLKSDTLKDNALDMKSDVRSSDKKYNPFETTQNDLKQDLFKARPSDLEDVFRSPSPDLKKGIFQDSPIYAKQNGHTSSTQHAFSPLPHQDSKAKAIEEDDYPVFENILLIGQEKCVEDWPEDSPVLNPDWKPPGRYRLRRESLRVTMEKENGKEDFADNGHEKDGKMKKGRRFSVTLGYRRGSKSKYENPNSERRKSQENFLDDNGDINTSCRGSKENYLDEATCGSLNKPRRDSKFLEEYSETKPEFLREGAGEGEENNITQHKKGKKIKIPFLQPRGSKENILDVTKCDDLSGTRRDSKSIPEPEENLPGATCADYHLSEAAEAEWLSAQEDMMRCKHPEAEEIQEKEADTDSLMDWWNSVELWDEFPSDVKEDLTEEEEAKILVMLAEKVQKGIRVFNKVFIERAEGLWKHIITLGAIADNTCSVHKKARIANITGGTTTAVGGVAAITGLALVPITFGASLIVTAVGVGVAAAGGLASASAAISDNVNNSMDRKKVEHVVEDYEAKMADVSKCLKFISDGLEKMRIRSEKRSTWIFHPDWETRRAVQIASLGEGEVAQAVRVVNMIYGQLGSLFQGMKSFYGVHDAREIKKGAKKEFAAKVRDVAQHLQDGLMELYEIREQLQDAVGYI
ncbi:uncharacterized protein LOC108940849 isoform X2 [Scleropages formosus]|uniref:uncharacterized protein LOC108940849 isoform X2 n=1 Tax=Scleropages formosus TaxID=113540 RepID=UPI0010FA8152|nr:uncharacterized protein LOC108940849 isoform X2 [Scleropages formosus]